MTTDRAAALAAKLRKADMELRTIGSRKEALAILKDVIAELEASRPAQDIVAEMREKVEADILERLVEKVVALESKRTKFSITEGNSTTAIYIDLVKKSDVLAILSPTKNTAPTEAEES